MSAQESKLGTACKQFEQDLVLFYYGELGSPDRDKLQAHLNRCQPCAGYLSALGVLMPITVQADQPPQEFWDDYSRKLRRKLDGLDEQRSWWQRSTSRFQPWSLTALATAAVVALALAFTLNRGGSPREDGPPEENALIEVLPMAENLEFFEAMDVLETMDLLESMGNSAA